MDVVINESVKENLSPDQITFVQLAFQRVNNIQGLLIFDGIEAEIRLLYYKELFSLYTELDGIKQMKIFESNLEIHMDKLIMGVKFIRNVLAHFPLFKCWDDIWITKSMAKSMFNGRRKGAILSYLESDDLNSLMIRITFTSGESKQVNYMVPKNKGEDERIYLKDIIDERDGIEFLLYVMRHLITVKETNK